MLCLGFRGEGQSGNAVFDAANAGEPLDVACFKRLLKAGAREPPGSHQGATMQPLATSRKLLAARMWRERSVSSLRSAKEASASTHMQRSGIASACNVTHPAYALCVASAASQESSSAHAQLLAAARQVRDSWTGSVAEWLSGWPLAQLGSSFPGKSESIISREAAFLEFIRFYFKCVKVGASMAESHTQIVPFYRARCSRKIFASSPKLFVAGYSREQSRAEQSRVPPSQSRTAS